MTAVIIWLASIVTCVYLADRYGRSQALAFAAGILFGWVAVFYYLIVGDSIDKKIERVLNK